MEVRKAIIDLGSNTFHLLIIAIRSNGTFDQIYKERKFVGLATGGIATIDDDRIDKALGAIGEFKTIIDSYDVEETIATGTAALRTASNGQFLAHKIQENFGIKVEIIQGDREADLIYKGVRLIADMKNDNHIIMDIGGGSVEFILVENGEKSWSKSYNIGVGVLHDLFHNFDPISLKNHEDLKTYLANTLTEMFEITEKIPIQSLIGASGSFEVIETMNDLNISKNKTSRISIEDYKKVSSIIISSTQEQREKMNGLPKSRVKLIVVAMILIDEIIHTIDPEYITISPYALKEGLISEMVNK